MGTSGSDGEFWLDEILENGNRETKKALGRFSAAGLAVDRFCRSMPLRPFLLNNHDLSNNRIAQNSNDASGRHFQLRVFGFSGHDTANWARIDHSSIRLPERGVNRAELDAP
jgi:hypothetical protein